MALNKPDANLQDTFWGKMINSADFLVVVSDIEGRIIEFNMTCEKITGYSIEEVKGEKIQDIFLVPEEKEQVLSSFAFNKKEKYKNYWLTKYAERRLISWTNNFIEGSDNTYIISTGIDITEHKKTEKALRESEEKYRFLINNINEAVVVTQDDFYKFANPSALKLFKCSYEELTTKPFKEFVHPHDRDMVLGRYRRRLEGENIAKRYSFRIIAADGSNKWVEVSSVVVEWEGQPATITLLNDITERKNFEEEMFKASKLESIGILAGGVAHDFNNYLATLLGNISLALSYTDNPDKIYEKLENMKKVTFKAKELTEQLFIFAKGDEPDKKTMSIKPLIKESIVFALTGSNVNSHFSLPEDLSPVEIDSGQIIQVLHNITLNAVQAMPEGGDIWINAENITLSDHRKSNLNPLPEGEYVKVSITDNGPGIPAEYLSKIFDPFFSTKIEGSGLGLATSYSIIKNHGGYIQVDSQPGEGTTFTFFLLASPHKDEEKNQEDNITYGKGKILIMEDQEDVRNTIGEMLSVLGYEAHSSRDGKEAIDKYLAAKNSQKPFDLIITDLTVSDGIGGKSTIKQLLQKDPEAKAVVVSGYSNDPVIENYKDYGFVGVLNKPFSIEKLSRVVYDIIIGE